jgi:hypothetical protein
MRALAVSVKGGCNYASFLHNVVIQVAIGAGKVGTWKTIQASRKWQKTKSISSNMAAAASLVASIVGCNLIIEELERENELSQSEGID